MEITKIGPVTQPADHGIDSSVPTNNFEVGSLQQHPDAVKVEESCFSSICTMIVDLFNSIIAFLKNLCGSPNPSDPFSDKQNEKDDPIPPSDLGAPQQKSVITFKWGSLIAYSYSMVDCFINGEVKFSLIASHPHGRISFPTVYIRESEKCFADSSLKKEDVKDALFTFLRQNSTYKLIFHEKPCFVEFFALDKRFKREEDLDLHNSKLMMTPVFSLADGSLI